MKKIVNLLLLLMLSLSFVACQETTEDLSTTTTTTTISTTASWSYTQIPDNLTYGEKVALFDNQYNIALFVTEDLTTSIGINFELPSSGKGFVEYKELSSNVINTKEAIYKSTPIGKKTVHNYELILDELTPNAVYEYRIRNEASDIVSDVHQFKTKETDPDEFSFMFLADPQENSALGYMAYSYALMNVLDEINEIPSFMMFVGDIVNDADIRSEWDNFFTYSSPFIYNVPIMATTGNHDIAGISGSRMSNFEFDGYFNLPNNGPIYTPFDEIENDERPANFDDGKTYSFNYDNTHFVAINTETLCDGTTTCSTNDTTNVELLKTWLNNDLSSHSMKWTIVFLHRGPYTLSYNTYKVREELVPIFEANGVDLVISGHDHQYSRSVYSSGNMIEFNRSNIYNLGTLSLVSSTETDYHFNDYNPSIGVTYLVGNTSGTKYYGGEKNSGIDVHYAFIESNPVLPYITITDSSIEVKSYGLLRSSEFQLEVEGIYILESFTLRK